MLILFYTPVVSYNFSALQSPHLCHESKFPKTKTDFRSSFRAMRNHSNFHGESEHAVRLGVSSVYEGDKLSPQERQGQPDQVHRHRQGRLQPGGQRRGHLRRGDEENARCFAGRGDHIRCGQIF